MEAYEYATMAAFETSYWWYRGLHGALRDTLQAAGVGREARILDAGCGTGGNLLSLGKQFPNASGFDYSADAAPFWAARGLRQCCLASINEMPYPSASFDAVLSIDVLETEGVDEARAVAELWRVTRPGGIIVLVVPAYRWLLTEEHHRAVHASRRYLRPEVVALLRQHPVEILRSTHYFATLFPAIAAYRLALQRFSRPHGAQTEPAPRSELTPLPPVVNELLAGVMRVERGVLRAVDLPFGSSILTVARKIA